MNQEHYNRLKEGANEWNKWRRQHPEIKPDLKKADLSGAFLVNANLDNANLANANLSSAMLNSVTFIGANLNGINLSNADLSNANLFGADLTGATFINPYLSRTDFTMTKVKSATFTDVDLSKALNLEKVIHYGPSTLDQSTLAKSEGKIPKGFLLGIGFKKWELESARLSDPGLTPDQVNGIKKIVEQLRMESLNQNHNLFISYSHADSAFVDFLEPKLRDNDISFWRDIHDLTSGLVEKADR